MARAAGRRQPAWRQLAWRQLAWRQPAAPVIVARAAWASTPAIAPAATAGPSSRVTGSPRWLVRDHVLGPPGGRRFIAEYASLAAPAAVAPAVYPARLRRPTHLPIPPSLRPSG